jgi:phosphoribosylamine--glycine ligase
MKVLVVGAGGREHALAWSLSRSSDVSAVYCAPGNAGTSEIGVNLSIPASDIPALAGAAASLGVSLTVVGPEQPLAAGIADVFAARGLAVFGPTRAAARIEWSKAFAKRLLDEAGIPQARYGIFEHVDPALAFVRALGGRCVVKADGLAAGKGAIVCRDGAAAARAVDDMLRARAFGDAGGRIAIEELLEGDEISAMAIVDGEVVLPLPLAQDHKRIGEGDTGPNTGGMGAIAPLLDGRYPSSDEIADRILRPAARALARAGTPFHGILYAGVMVTADGPKVLEFNARFGDPEAQTLLSLLDIDLAGVLRAASSGALGDVTLKWRPGTAVCVVAASAGYPERAAPPQWIRGLEDAARENDARVFLAGAERTHGAVTATGGRVLSVVGVGADGHAARERAYAAMSRISFDGMQVRRDIGLRALGGTGAHHETRNGVAR